MGYQMVVKKSFAELLKPLILEQGRSPYDALCIIREQFPDMKTPCLRTIYYPIEKGDMGILYGQTPYHPSRKRKPHAHLHPAKTVPGRHLMTELPEEYVNPQVLGCYEMDTVVSGVGGQGGILVVIDRFSRLYDAEKLNHINQEEVLLALKRMKKQGRLPHIKCMITDNGCEFLSDKKLKEVLGAEIYDTHAYAAFEKGKVENGNRMFRRIFPKKTDFSKISRATIRQAVAWVNSIHRRLLKGKTAYDYHASLTSFNEEVSGASLGLQFTTSSSDT